jgi:hypothetical protein
MSVETRPRHDVVWFELDGGPYELGVDECRELIRLLGRRVERPGAGAALACARSLETLLDEGSLGAGALSEPQLDALADAAWDGLRRDGPDAVPERVLRLLDALRARHGRD